MRVPSDIQPPLGTARFLAEASALVELWKQQNASTIQKLMHVSAKKSDEVMAIYADWSNAKARQVPAIDAFVGDIYSGLQAHTWSSEDRVYAHEHLIILSGLYGGLRACDGTTPYRLEMGYKLPDGRSMYQFWGDRLATLITEEARPILNLSAVEYTKAVLPYVTNPVVTPTFLTISPKTRHPTFVAVHAKIARGAFARWVLQERITDTIALCDFNELGYTYNAEASTPNQPVFICESFGGLGLSIRLT